MDTTEKFPSNEGLLEPAIPLPKNPFVDMAGASSWQETMPASSPEGQATRFAAAELERDLASGKKGLVEALRFPVGSHAYIRSILSGLSSKFSWLLALDDAFFPPHALQMMCGGITRQPIFDGWNQLLSAFTAASAMFQDMGISIEGMTTENPALMGISEYERHLVTIESLRGEIEALLLDPQRDAKALDEKQLRHTQALQVPFNAVDKNPQLMKLLYTKKDAVVGKPDHPVWREIWGQPEFRDFYGKIMAYYQSILRELTLHRLQKPTPERVFEASFLLPGAVPQHLAFITDLANAVERRFMTSPIAVPSLPEGQRMMIFVTSDQRFQSPDQLRDEIRNIAAKHAIQLPDIDVRWNQQA